MVLTSYRGEMHLITSRVSGNLLWHCRQSRNLLLRALHSSVLCCALHALALAGNALVESSFSAGARWVSKHSVEKLQTFDRMLRKTFAMNRTYTRFFIF